MMLTLLIIFYIEQLQSENASEKMLLVEAEFHLLGFRTVSGNCFGTHARSKGRKAANLWAVGVEPCVCAHAVHLPVCTIEAHLLRKTQTTELLDVILDNRTHSRKGNIIQNTDQMELPWLPSG